MQELNFEKLLEARQQKGPRPNVYVLPPTIYDTAKRYGWQEYSDSDGTSYLMQEGSSAKYYRSERLIR